MRGLVRAVDGISRLFGAIAAALVIVLVVLMLYDVVLRYAFNAPTAWGNDLNTWLMGASFVLSIAYAMSTDSHVRVDLLYDRRTRPRIRYFDLVGLTLIILPTVGWVTLGPVRSFHDGLPDRRALGLGRLQPDRLAVQADPVCRLCDLHPADRRRDHQAGRVADGHGRSTTADETSDVHGVSAPFRRTAGRRGIAR